MARYGIVGAATIDDIDEFFSFKSNNESRPPNLSIIEKRDRRLVGRMLDKHGNPIGPESTKSSQRNYRARERDRFEHGTGYVAQFRAAQEAEMQRMKRNLDRMNAGDAAAMDLLETRTTTSSAISSPYDLPLYNQLDAKVSYKGFRPGVYNTELPITKHRQRIVDNIDAMQCTIIEGMTGCGKTTQVPQYILDHFAAAGKYCRIAVTQPRRIAAISLAGRVCAERGWTMGTYCGYQVARDSKLDSDKTCITYMTTGILLQRLISDRNLNRYTHIVLDEVHERDQDTDLALLIVRKFLKSVSPHVKVVLMSATLQCKLFADYFADVVQGQMASAPVINVEGRLHDVHETYWSDPILNHMVAVPHFEDSNPLVYPEAFKLVVKMLIMFDEIEQKEQCDVIARGEPPTRGTVLIFLPGLADIQELSSHIEKDNELKKRKLLVLPLHSSITLEEQARVFDKPHVFYRKVILSTNIAESSITVPDIKYVIDFCLTKSLQTDRETHLTCLRLEWASKANCKQRKGRAGRVSNGRVYRLVHKGFYQHQLPEFGEPEMRRCPLTQLILKVKKLGPEEPRALLSLAIDPPDMEHIRKAILKLKEAGALANINMNMTSYNPYDGELTLVGHILSSLPLNVELGKLLVFGYVLGVLPDCLIIAASLHTRPIFKGPLSAPVQTFMKKLFWDRGLHSDPMATVNAYREWYTKCEEEQFHHARNAEERWCRENYLQKRTLNEVKDVIMDLTRRLEEHGVNVRTRNEFNENSPTENQLLIKVALACAFYPNYFTNGDNDGMLLSTATKTLSGKSPLNTIYIGNIPNNQGILYKKQIHDLIAQYIPNVSFHAAFENTRCLMEFKHSLGDCNKIPNAVYAALHISHLMPRDRRLELNIYVDDDVKTAMAKIDEIQKQQAASENRLVTNRMYVDDGDRSNEPTYHDLSHQSGSWVHYQVVHVECFGHFWCHDANDQPENITNEINSCENLTRSVAVYNPAVGMLCIAPFLGLYYRAEVTAIQGQCVVVFFPDYGNKETVSLGDIRELLPQFRQLRYHGIECKLSHIKPASTVQPSILNQSFTNELLGQEFYCRIFSAETGVLRFDKVVNVKNTDVDIHEQFLSKGFAVPAPESYFSIQNNMNGSRDAADAASRWGFELSDALPSDLRHSGKRQRLTGPYSPIQIKFYNMTSIGSKREVKVELSSVNGITLDEEPGDHHDKLMVAAAVSVTSSGDKVLARETTLMPNIHGLPALICLLFAPSLQIRCDRLHRFYTGALCGLGRDPTTNDSVYPDHDIEMAFDVKIDLEDVEMINKIRMRFNYCLGVANNERIDENRVSNMRPAIRSYILKLLNKLRVSREKVYTNDHLTWTNQVDVLDHNLRDTPVDDESLYRLITPPSLELGASVDPSLQDKRERNEYLREHCRTLTRLAATSKLQQCNVVCELCKVQIETTRQLSDHISRRRHKQREYELLRSAS